MDFQTVSCPSLCPPETNRFPWLFVAYRDGWPDRIATTGPLSEATIPVSPQAARPAVSERDIGAGGVPGCSGMPGAWKSQPAPGKARGFRGQDTVEGHGGFDVVMEKIVQREQENPASNGREMIDDFLLWRSRRWSRTNAPPKKPRWRTWVARDFNHPNASLSESGALAVVVESFPETPHPRIPPVAVASGAIEASVMGEGEGSGGGDGGARGALPPVGGSKGPEPLASPNVLHWVGWLPGTTRCAAGPAVPASHGAPARRARGVQVEGRLAETELRPRVQSRTVERFTVGAGNSGFPTGGETCGL